MCLPPALDSIARLTMEDTMKTTIASALLALALSISPLYAGDAGKSCSMEKGTCCKAASCCTADAACCKEGGSCCTATCSKDHACKHANAGDACAKACGKVCQKTPKS